MTSVRCSECEALTLNLCPNCKAVPLCLACQAEHEVCPECDDDDDTDDGENGDDDEYDDGDDDV